MAYPEDMTEREAYAVVARALGGSLTPLSPTVGRAVTILHRLGLLTT